MTIGMMGVMMGLMGVMMGIIRAKTRSWWIHRFLWISSFAFDLTIFFESGIK